jgi:hypothetical protein
MSFRRFRGSSNGDSRVSHFCRSVFLLFWIACGEMSFRAVCSPSVSFRSSDQPVRNAKRHSTNIFFPFQSFQLVPSRIEAIQHGKSLEIQEDKIVRSVL